MMQTPQARPRARMPEASSNSWPFVPSRDFAQALRQLMQASQGLSLAGWEASCRFAPGVARTNRLLLGFDTSGVALRRLSGLPRELAMPEALAQRFLKELPHARRILLAVEEGERGVEIKAYHEYGDSAGEASDLPAALAMRGRKWYAHLPGQGAQRCSDYLRPGLCGAALRQWLRDRTGMAAQAGPALDVLALAAALAGEAAELDFLTVTEAPSARLSCCMRLYDSHLTLRTLHPALVKLAQAWNLSPSLLARLPHQRRLGWLAAGTDALAHPFLTVYGESSLADARQALALGAPHGQD